MGISQLCQICSSFFDSLNHLFGSFLGSKLTVSKNPPGFKLLKKKRDALKAKFQALLKEIVDTKLKARGIGCKIDINWTNDKKMTKNEKNKWCCTRYSAARSNIVTEFLTRCAGKIRQVGEGLKEGAFALAKAHYVLASGGDRGPMEQFVAIWESCIVMLQLGSCLPFSLFLVVYTFGPFGFWMFNRHESCDIMCSLVSPCH